MPRSKKVRVTLTANAAHAELALSYMRYLLETAEQEARAAGSYDTAQLCTDLRDSAKVEDLDK